MSHTFTDDSVIAHWPKRSGPIRRGERPKKAVVPKLSEKQVTDQCTAFLRHKGWLVVRLQSGVFSRPGAPGRITVGQRGLPDYVALKPGACFFLEFKAPGKKLRPDQEIFIENLRHQDFYVMVVDNFADFEIEYNEYA